MLEKLSFILSGVAICIAFVATWTAHRALRYLEKHYEKRERQCRAREDHQQKVTDLPPPPEDVDRRKSGFFLPWGDPWKRR